jgi:hypothetical protein
LESKELLRLLLPSVDDLVIDVLPPIAYHRGIWDSCSGFGVCWSSTVNAKTVNLYWFGPSTVIE